MRGLEQQVRLLLEPFNVSRAVTDVSSSVAKIALYSTQYMFSCKATIRDAVNSNDIKKLLLAVIGAITTAMMWT